MVNFLKKFLIPLFLFVISLGLYANSLGHGFVLDDHAILERASARERVYTYYFLPAPADPWRSLIRGDNRPLRTLSLALDMVIWKRRPWGFHLSNIILHGACVILVWLVISGITGRKGIGFFGALIFSSHPIATETVNWVKCRGGLLSTLFFLLAFWLYLRYGEAKRKGLLLALGLISFSLALLAKEMAITLPAIILLHLYFFGKGRFKERIKESFRLLLGFILAAGFYLLLRFTLLGEFIEVRPWRPPPGTKIPILLYGFTHYLKLLIFPIGLCADYDFLPLSISQGSLTFLYLAIISAGIIVSILVYKWSPSLWPRRGKVISFAALFFWISLLPVTHIIPLNTIIAERFLYLPLVGFAMILPVIFPGRGLKSRPRRLVGSMGLAIIIGLYSIGTVRRNRVWRNETTLASSILEEYPNHTGARINLAGGLYQAGQLSLAAEQLQLAIQSSPRADFTYEAYYNLALVRMSQKDFIAALEAAKGATHLNPTLPTAWYMTGNIYLRMEKWDEALGALRRAISIDPHSNAHYDLALVYEKKGEYNLAIQHLREFLKIKPGHKEAIKKLQELRRISGANEM